MDCPLPDFEEVAVKRIGKFIGACLNARQNGTLIMGKESRQNLPTFSRNRDGYTRLDESADHRAPRERGAWLIEIKL